MAQVGQKEPGKSRVAEIRVSRVFQLIRLLIFGSSSGTSMSRRKTGSEVYCAMPIPFKKGRKPNSRSRTRQPNSAGVQGDDDTGAPASLRTFQISCHNQVVRTAPIQLEKPGEFPISLATASMWTDAWLEKTKGMPNAEAARPTAKSTSGCPPFPVRRWAPEKMVQARGSQIIPGRSPALPRCATYAERYANGQNRFHWPSVCFPGPHRRQYRPMLPVASPVGLVRSRRAASKGISCRIPAAPSR